MSECCFAVLSEASTFCRAMAVTLSAATLPAVVEELLSEMEAAVRESARSTGRRECVAALWVVDLAPPVRKARGGGLWARGALVSGLRPRALRPELPVLFPRVFHLQTLIRLKKKKMKEKRKAKFVQETAQLNQEQGLSVAKKHVRRP